MMTSLGLCLFPGWREHGVYLLGGGLTAQIQDQLYPAALREELGSVFHLGITTLECP